MHPNPTFRSLDHAKDIALARDRGFGTLVVNAPECPLMAHIPFLLSDDGTEAELHLVRSNPIARMDGPLTVKLAVMGPEGYISPDWYGIDDQVPTWNYAAVHLTGQLERMPDATLQPMLARLSAHFENRLMPKPPWTLDKMSKDALDRMLRMIVPFRLLVTAIDGTWKLGQNKTDAARLGAADGVSRADQNRNSDGLAGLMRKPPAL